MYVAKLLANIFLKPNQLVCTEALQPKLISLHIIDSKSSGPWLIKNNMVHMYSNFTCIITFIYTSMHGLSRMLLPLMLSRMSFTIKLLKPVEPSTAMYAKIQWCISISHFHRITKTYSSSIVLLSRAHLVWW